MECQSLPWHNLGIEDAELRQPRPGRALYGREDT